MAVLIKEIMVPNPPSLRDDAKIGDAVELIRHEKVDAIPIVDAENNLVAIVSNGDIIDYVVTNANRINQENVPYFMRTWERIDGFPKYVKASMDHPIMNCATRRVVTVHLEDGVRDSSAIMSKKEFKQMPVVDDGKLVGMISRNDIIRGIFDRSMIDSAGEMTIQ